MEDLIPDEELVVSITRGGYAKRTRADQYRTQKRGGKGVRGATLRGDDVVEHFIATSNHHWLLFFTTAGRVYRTKAYNLPEASRDAKGGHVAGLLSFQPDENIAQVLAIRDYDQAPYLVLATRNGLAKKTRLGDYNSPRQAGVIAINFREDDDELIGAELVNADDDILLVSRKGQAIRFRADDTQLRPMGRATSGVSGMKFRRRRLAAVDVGDPGRAGRGRGGRRGEGRGRRRVHRAGRAAGREGAVRLHDHRRRLRQAVPDLGVPPTRRAAASASRRCRWPTRTAASWSARSSSSRVTRSSRSPRAARSCAARSTTDFRPTGRSTMGVKFVTPKSGDAVAVVARSVEAKEEDEGIEAAPEDGVTDATASPSRAPIAESQRCGHRMQQSTRPTIPTSHGESEA